MTEAKDTFQEAAEERYRTKAKLKEVRKHARDENPFVELQDFDYTWLRARTPFEFVEFGERSYLITN